MARLKLFPKLSRPPSMPLVKDLRLIVSVSFSITAFATLIIVAFWGSYANPWIALAAALLAGPVSAFPLTSDRPTPASNRWWIMGWVPIFAMNIWQLTPPLPEIITSWPTVVSSIMLGTVCLMGRSREAMVVSLMVAVVGMHWGWLRGISFEQGGGMVAFLAPLITGVICDYGLRHGMADLNRAYAERLVTQEGIARLESTEAARQQYRDRVRERAGSLLEKIASGEELSAEEKRQCRLVEASLRDGIRGRTLSTVRVDRAATAARERGAVVSLIDDRQGWKCPAELRKAVEENAIELLRMAEPGDQCTVRLMPVGRRNLATVVLSKASGEGERRMVPAPEPAARAEA